MIVLKFDTERKILDLATKFEMIVRLVYDDIPPLSHFLKVKGQILGLSGLDAYESVK